MPEAIGKAYRGLVYHRFDPGARHETEHERSADVLISNGFVGYKISAGPYFHKWVYVPPKGQKLKKRRDSSNKNCFFCVIDDLKVSLDACSQTSTRRYRHAECRSQKQLSRSDTL